MVNRIGCVSVLGTAYEIFEGNTIDFPLLENMDGCCDHTVKQIIVSDMSQSKDKPDALTDLEAYKKQVIRHELIHAFLYESGLSINSTWATNEEMVDFFAIQFEKLMNIFKLADTLKDGA